MNKLVPSSVSRIIIAMFLAVLFLFVTGRVSIILREMDYNPSNILALLITAPIMFGIYAYFTRVGKNDSSLHNNRQTLITSTLKLVPVILIFIAGMVVAFYVLWLGGLIHPRF